MANGQTSVNLKLQPVKRLILSL